MVYLDKEAAEDYQYTTDIALYWRLIGWAEYFSRIAYLRSMLQPNTDLRNRVSKYLRDKQELALDWPEEEKESLPSLPIVSLEPENDNGSASGGDVLHLTTSQAGVHGEKWVFHKGDPDYYPSVPHGHLKTTFRIKLDPYRGFTYDTADGNKLLARESRAFTASLWRDNDFRQFAIEALKHFDQQNKRRDWLKHRCIHHRGPFRIPRKR